MLFRSGMVKTMQGSGTVCTRVEEAVHLTNANHNYKGWQESPRKLRPRTNLQANRHSEPVLPVSNEGDTVVRSAAGERDRENIHYISTSYGRVYFDGDPEDQDIDDSQSKRWRGG